MGWEKYLDEDQLKVLKAYREHYRKNYPNDMSFARRFVETTNSLSFHDMLKGAEGDPEEKALLYYEAEISSYPFSLVFPDAPDYDV